MKGGFFFCVVSRLIRGWWDVLSVTVRTTRCGKFTGILEW